MIQDTLSADLYDHLIFWMREVRPSRHLRWVMSPDWWRECRNLAGPDCRVLWEPSFRGPELLFGIQVEIRDDGGVPHLVAP